MEASFLAIFVILELCFAGIHGQEPIESVVKYTLEQFTEEVSKKNHFVLFFVPWNSESKSVAPIWEELGVKYNNRGGDDLVLAKVDCTTDVILCSKQNVTDYPTVKFYKFGSNNVNGVKFRGVRDFQSLEQFLNININPGSDQVVFGARVASPPPSLFGLQLLIDENFDAYIENEHVFINFCAPWSSRCMDLNNIWPEVAEHFQYDDDIHFGYLDCTMYKSKCNEHNVRGYPSLLWFSEGSVVEKYPKKELDFESIKAYVYEKLGKKEVQMKSTAELNEQQNSPILIMDEDNFDEVLENEPLIIVNFQTPWCTPCQKLEPIWSDIGLKYKYNKKIKIAQVDCTRNKALCETLDIEEFPTLHVYAKGKQTDTYDGELKADELANFIEEIVHKFKDEL